MNLFGKVAPPDDYVSNPHAFLADLQRRGRIGFVEDRNMWVVSGYETLSQLLRSPSVVPGGASSFADKSPAFRASLAHQIRLWLKPPFCDDIQLAVSRAVADAVSAVLEGDQADLVPALAHRIPMRVMAALLGIPAADLPMLSELGRAVLGGYDLSWPGRVPSAAGVARALIRAYFSRQLAASTTDAGPPLRQAMVTCAVQHALPEASLHDAFGTMVTAGVTTTASALANILVRLLSTNTSSTGPAPVGQTARWADEFLRLDSPILGIRRKIGADLEFDGYQMRRGQEMLLLTAAANRDPDRFADPHRFWPDRPNMAHLSFGHGAFYCLGAHLARLEINCLLQALAPCFHRFRASAAPTRVQGWLTHDVATIPVSITPGV